MLVPLEPPRRDVHFELPTFNEYYKENLFDLERDARQKFGKIARLADEVNEQANITLKAYEPLIAKAKTAGKQVSDRGAAEGQLSAYASAVRALKSVKELAYKLTKLVQNY